MDIIKIIDIGRAESGCITVQRDIDTVSETSPAFIDSLTGFFCFEGIKDNGPAKDSEY